MIKRIWNEFFISYSIYATLVFYIPSPIKDIKHTTRFINTVWNENSFQILYFCNVDLLSAVHVILVVVCTSAWPSKKWKCYGWTIEDVWSQHLMTVSDLKKLLIITHFNKTLMHNFSQQWMITLRKIHCSILCYKFCLFKYWYIELKASCICETCSLTATKSI